MVYKVSLIAIWFLFLSRIPKILLINGVFSIKIDLSLPVSLQKTVVINNRNLKINTVSLNYPFSILWKSDYRTEKSSYLNKRCNLAEK